MPPVISDSLSNEEDEVIKPDIRPENLSGELASTWRKFVIRTMFPRTNVPSEPLPAYIPPDKVQHRLLYRPSFADDLKFLEGSK